MALESPPGIRFLSNTGEVVIKCYRNLNLLAHAQIEELETGSLCGGHGICGGDKMLVKSEARNLSSVTEVERNHLSPEQIASGWRLGCQCWPTQDDLHMEIFLNR